jgi:rod shape-determining protein MreC
MALPRRARSTRLLVVSLVAISLVTITVDFREGENGPLASVGRIAMTVISPLQKAVSKVTHPIGNFFSTLVRLPSIRDENERLKDEIADLKAQVSTGLADETRLHELEALLGVQKSLGPDVQTAAAQVIANGVSNFEWTITIGKGSNDGIAVDQPVLAPAGLVGHVVRVAPDSAVVRLVLDPDSSVAGRLDVSGKTGLVTGAGNQDMRMGLIDTATDVQAGERVVTAGFRIPGVAQSLYPPGILIGTVSRVLPGEASLEKYVTVSPAVDFSSLDVVLVVLADGSG